MGVDEWPGPPAWIHGDLLPGNLLVRDRRLGAVIDFGFLGRGDPAIELLPCWSLFDAQAGAAYVQALGFDEATWVRGWAWPLSISLYALADLWDTFSEQNRVRELHNIDRIVQRRNKF
jgi:aminoglycoside phosphotransferase (APT) family kinase protein